MKLILASTSPYRQSLLAKLTLAFDIAAPNIDESPLPDESPQDLAKRLAIAKAKIIADRLNEGYVIGCDQVASLHNQLLNKPLEHARAVEQLRACSGKTVHFYTGLCVINTSNKQQLCSVDCNQVRFKPLNAEQIDTYLNIEQPYDCAGSFKCEGLGIILFDSLSGKDPNALIGLPLISLTQLLTQMQVDLFAHLQSV